MIWLAWRQHRLSILAGLATCAALAVFLMLTGNAMRHTYQSLGLDQCSLPTWESCPDLSDRFERQVQGYQFIVPLFLILPALVGVFWGAPLVSREIEQGTHRLVWTQSITRSRWLTVKVTLFVVAVIAGFGAVTWLVTWWASPLLSTRPQRFEPGIFDLLGLAPIAYALAAFAIGVAAGTVTKKMLPAMGLTLVLFLILRVGVELGLRPHYMEPITTSIAFPKTEAKVEFPKLPADRGWVISAQTLDAAGRLISDGVGIERNATAASCPELAGQAEGVAPDLNALDACVERSGFHVVAVYQPDDRYWRFQITEALIYVVLSGALIAGSGWWLRRRTT